MSTPQQTQTTPAAVLADERGEGLNRTPIKEQVTAMVSTPEAARISLDEATTVDVQRVGTNVEVTFTTTSSAWARSTFGIALTASEARRVASALIDGAAPTLATDPVDVGEHAAIAVQIDQQLTRLATQQVTR